MRDRERGIEKEGQRRRDREECDQGSVTRGVRLREPEETEGQPEEPGEYDPTGTLQQRECDYESQRS